MAYTDANRLLYSGGAPGGGIKKYVLYLTDCDAQKLSIHSLGRERNRRPPPLSPRPILLPFYPYLIKRTMHPHVGCLHSAVFVWRCDITACLLFLH